MALIEVWQWDDGVVDDYYIEYIFHFDGEQSIAVLYNGTVEAHLFHFGEVEDGMWKQIWP